MHKTNYAILFIFALLFIPFTGFSQEFYQQMPDSTDQAEELKKLWEQKYETSLSKLPKKDQKQQREYYAFRNEILEAELDGNNLLFGEKEQAYLQNILNKILRANPDIQGDELQIFIRKDGTANAVSIGNGVLLIHIGLIRLLDNESQLAFVIGHELAHYTLDHSDEAIAAIARKLNDKAFKAAYREVQREVYMSYTKRTKFLESTVFDISRHSREKELEADSMGLVYMISAGYEPKEAISLIGILDHSDKPKYDPEKALDLRSIFHHDSYPFKDSWEKTTTLLSDVITMKKVKPFWELDSLKTHPDCADRISAVLPVATADYNNSKRIFHQPKESFESMIQSADYESFRAYFDADNIGRSLFEAINMAEAYPKDPYAKYSIGKSFLGLHDASANHEFGLVVEAFDRRQAASYRSLLEWLPKLRKRDYSALGYYYLQTHWEVISLHPECIFLQAELAMEAGLKDELEALKALYRRKFPKGSQAKLIQDLHIE